MITSSVMTAMLLVAQTSTDRLPNSDKVLTLTNCIVTAKDQIEFPAQQQGVIKTLETVDGVAVQEGFVTTAGELFGKLDDEEAAARAKAARLDGDVAAAEKAKADASVIAAEKTSAVALAEYIESLDVNSRVANSIPETQLRRQKLTHERAQTEEGVAREDVRVAFFTIGLRGAQVELAEINLKKYRFIAPFDGVIVQVYRKVGEWVSPGDPIARLVRMDRLRVEGFVDGSRYLPEDIEGRPVRIIVRRPNREPEEFESTVTFVSPIVEASGEYRVWAEVENRAARGKHWILHPGMEAELEIELP
jgi:multidrug resistance efflux pump